MLWIVLAGIVVAIVAAIYRWRNRKPRTPPDPLDCGLLPWPDGSWFTVRHLLTSLVVIGRSGSGKTSSSLYQLLLAIVRHGNIAHLHLASKPEERQQVEAIFADAKRRDALLIFGANEPYRYNFLAEELAAGGGVRDIVQLLFVIGESLLGGDAASSDESRFWRSQAELLLFYMVLVVKLATGTVTASSLHQFLASAALSLRELADEASFAQEDIQGRMAARKWKAGVQSQYLAAAFQASKTPEEEYDFKQAMDFFLTQFPNQPDKLRGSVIAQVSSILFPLNSGKLRELFCTTTNISPATLAEQKKSIYIDMPAAGKGISEAMALAIWKYGTQRYILRRHAKPGDPILVIFADEAQKVMSSHSDSDFLALSRSHYGASIYATQSLHSFAGSLKGQGGENQAKLLASLFGTKILHACDPDTAKWGAELVGKALTIYIGTSMAPVEDLWEEMVGQSKVTTSTSEHMDYILQPRDLLTGLRTGGPPDLCADAVVIRSEMFQDGNNFAFVTFSQKR